ncbi:E3 ubiquitin-protein ligase TRIM56-like isoform X4 [Scylla paramamosain]|uniref:E3 ubiquitin-protein ligase TRIM56-like isoform X4 n=1 Tax=Scylla paramamosain TaxID=85552 RepID=UPI0030833353
MTPVSNAYVGLAVGPCRLGRGVCFHRPQAREVVPFAVICDDNVEDCPVCLTTFDDTLRRPRTLPCGHTVCSPCIDGLKQQGAVTCPTCRVSHAVPEADQFPISYITEGLIRRLRRLASLPAEPGKQAAPPVTRPAPKATTGLSKRAQSLLQEQEVKVLAAIRSCQEEQSQLAEYLTTLGGWSSRQQRLQDELQTLVDQSKSAREAVRREEFRVEGRQEEVQQKEQQLHAALQSLRTAATRQEAYEVIEDTDLLVEKDSQTEGCLGVFPDVHAVTTVTKVAQASRAALQAATAAAAATQAALEAVGTAAAASGDSSLPAALAEASSIADRLQALLAPPLTMGEVVPAAPPCEVFLDLAWPGSVARRVVVSLPKDTPRGRQFMLLCSGQRGACYANTRLFEVMDEGQPGECVVGGDYQTGDGRGGAALLPHLDQGEYWLSGKAGAVWWWPWRDDPACGAQFSIIARDRQRGSIWCGVFGQVVRGLEVVQEAARHRPITEVTVVQCGVVLSR